MDVKEMSKEEIMKNTMDDFGGIHDVSTERTCSRNIC